MRRALTRFALLLAGLLLPACSSLPAAGEERAFCGELLRADEVTAERVAAARTGGADTIVLALHDAQPDAATLAAAAVVRSAGLRLGYWLEVGRSPVLADRHPQWLASLQGHGEWRRQFPELGAAAPGQVVKVWPWLPVAYAEAFAAHRDRIAAQLAALPSAEFVFLNDLQGPPAACGCGNTLCRWATDYTLGGRAPLRSTTPLGADAAAQFVAAVQQLAKKSEVIPVWVTECEEADTVADGACCGVGCYHGACWREFDRQWLALRAGGGRTALLLPYLAFGRDLERFGEPAGWVTFAIAHLRTRMQDRHRTEVPPGSLIAVLQGWGAVAPVAVQQARAATAGVTRTLLAREPIEQSWAPRLLTVAADNGTGR